MGTFKRYIENLVRAIIREEGIFHAMAADMQQLDAAIAEVRADVEVVKAKLPELSGIVADLQAKLAAVPDAPDFSAEIASLQAIDADLKAVFAAPA